MSRSSRDIESIIREGVKKDGYPDADSYSKKKIIQVLESCFEEIARSNPIYNQSSDMAYEMAKMQLVAFFNISEDDLDAYCGSVFSRWHIHGVRLV